jgi:hypothetical protein
MEEKRDLLLLYFDGAGAAKMNDGPMESQGIVAWEKLRPGKYFAERGRINALCEWGRPHGLELAWMDSFEWSSICAPSSSPWLSALSSLKLIIILSQRGHDM